MTRPPLPEPPADGPALPLWGWVLYGVVVGLIVAALIALWIVARRDRKDQQ
jgi:hypothetical protein